MTAQPIEHGGHLIPRPERTPAALRAALAQVAPHSLAKMERQQDEAVTMAARTGSVGPITQFLETWAVIIEIARIPAAAAQLRTAEYTAQAIDRDESAWRDAMDEIRHLYSTARESVTGE